MRVESLISWQWFWITILSLLVVIFAFWLFCNNLWFFCRVGLGHLLSLNLIIRVGTNHRRLNWVVWRITPLHAVADIHSSALASLGNSDRSRPAERLNHVDSVRDSLTFSTTFRVLMSVTNNLTDPSSLLSCEWCVLTDITESFHSWVFSFLLLLSSCSILFSNAYRSLVCAATSL